MIDLVADADRLRAVIMFQVGEESVDAVAAAARRRIEAAFAAGVRRIMWRARVGDEPSRRVAWACGFTFEGSLRGDWLTGGDQADSWVATLLADDAREPKTRWLEPVLLTANGVELRDQCAADESRYLETMNDPESLKWLGTLWLPKTPGKFREMVARRQVGPSTGSSVTWTVAEPSSGSYLGTIALFGVDGVDYRSAELGFRTHPDSRGRGLLTTALRRAIEHAFAAADDGGLGLERLSIGAGDTNYPSQGVARSCGFVETGRDRRCYNLHDGTVVDLVRFDLLRSEFAR